MAAPYDIAVKPYDACPAPGCRGRVHVVERAERVFSPDGRWTADRFAEYGLWCPVCSGKPKNADEERIEATIARASNSSSAFA